MWGWLRRATIAAERAGGGLGLDVVLYVAGAVFAVVTAAGSTLAAHRAWGGVAAAGYIAAAIIALAQLVGRSAGRRTVQRFWGAGARIVLTASAWAATALLPLVIQAVQRSGGRTDRAQEEVIVIEEGARRLLETGSPYLDRAAIAALTGDDRLLAYLPYQPGMVAFGVPRALDPASGWWSDSRVWFALATAACLAGALIGLRRIGAEPAKLVRAAQAATVLPVCALTLATGGNDLAVLGLCLLSLALATTGRFGWAGLAVGAAAAMKLFAWPVAVALGIYAITRGHGRRYGWGAVGLPVLTAVPALVLGSGALVENVLAFPFGRGLVTSPAESPLPGHLIATALPGGRIIATALLLAAGTVVAVVAVRTPPRTTAAAAVLAGCGLLAAFLLLPATRFGYLLYPVVLLIWAGALRPAPVPRIPVQPRPADSAVVLDRQPLT